ncbi:MAG TPA: sugar transferase [Gemmatimonadaceae bacterium]|nr:sugar transferase [Gemmatimonadaceae bacterium]
MLWEDVADVWNADGVGTSAHDRRKVHHLPIERVRPTLRGAATADAVRQIELVRDRADRRAAAGIEPRTRSEVLNRSVNVLIAALALAILSPILLLVAIAVRLTSRGPVLYKQTRVGLDRRRARVDALFDRRKEDNGGRIFTIYKFRSMYADAEAKSGAVWATREDPRVTPVGRFLRRTRLDELPQLVNVIKGDMNIVGPRPEQPKIFVELREEVAEYGKRQQVLPGITGWAQVNQSYDTSLEDVRSKVRLDLEYIERASVSADLQILMRTVPVVLFRKGAW